VRRYRLLAAAAAALAIAQGAALGQKPATPPLPVARSVLSNGLTVLALEDHTVPSVAVHIVYKVGSRNERSGITGLSHLFEHMMFNGSARFKPKVFDQLIEAAGGSSNAFTSPDTTEYHEEVSSGALATVLELEADRMRALRLDRQNLEQERAVVKEERRLRVDESVEGSMSELLWNTAFVAHPYRWEVAGFLRDLDAITLEDARRYFATYYAPNNAVMAVVGDFRTAELFRLVNKHFGPIRRAPAPPPVVQTEPPQRGERRSELWRPAELHAVTVGYKVPSFRHKDEPALNLLDSILSRGESSRLYRALIYDRQIAAAVYSANDSRLDGGLFTLYAQARPGHTAAECEQALYGVIEDIQKNGVEERELEKAKNAVRATHVRSFTTNAGRAMLLAEREALFGTWKDIYNHVPRHEAATPADVQRVARQYLVARKRTVVTLVPEQSGTAAQEQEAAK